MDYSTTEKKDFITTQEWGKEDLKTALRQAEQIKKRYYGGETLDTLDDKTLFMLFYNPSLRTRNSFESGMTQLGGHAHFLDASTSYIPYPGEETLVLEEGETRERVKDSANVLDRYGDGIAIRCFGEAIDYNYGEGNRMLRSFAEHTSKPVINMEDDKYHPNQAMADLLTLKEKIGLEELKGKKFVMSWAKAPSPWKPLSVPHSLILLMSRFGANVTAAYPEEFALDPEVEEQAKVNAEKNGMEFEVVNDMEEAFVDADIVYPKSWHSLEYVPPKTDEPQMDELVEVQKQYDWTCDEELMERTNDAYYMHCLPADVRDDLEVSKEVIDGENSIVYDEAENRLHAQKGILNLLMQ